MQRGCSAAGRYRGDHLVMVRVVDVVTVALRVVGCPVLRLAAWRKRRRRLPCCVFLLRWLVIGTPCVLIEMVMVVTICCCRENMKHDGGCGLPQPVLMMEVVTRRSMLQVGRPLSSIHH